jgi:hypothetical protein
MDADCVETSCRPSRGGILKTACVPRASLRSPWATHLAPLRGAFPLYAEHVRQLGGESPLLNLMEVKS